MAGCAASAYLSAVKWSDDGYYLKEFTQKFTLPQVAKIIKGQYLNLGVPSLSSPSLNQIVFFSSAGKRIKVAAQCVKFKDNRKVVPVGPKLAIPDNYDGWFEILSEEGKAVRCIESVAELVKRFPEICLVRENVKAYVSKHEESECIMDKVKTVHAGETLVLVSEVVASISKGKGPNRFLRCFTSTGESVYLSLEQKGKFSPVAGEENISGVHTIQTLLSKRFPLMVRLVHGKPPFGLKSQFLPDMRLYSLFEEECIVALPLLKDSTIISLPLTAALKLQAPRNVDVLTKLREYTTLTEKCNSLMQDVSDRIQIFDISLSKELRTETKSTQIQFHMNRKQKKNINDHPLRRSISDPQQIKGERSLSVNHKPDTGNDNRYDEIDQIYDYVRGFAPLSEKIKSDFEAPEKKPESPPAETEEEKKPEPPPIETIPIRKFSLDSSPQKITISISSKEKEEEDHVYEKLKNSTNQPVKPIRIPIRSNSAGRLYIPNEHSNKYLSKTPIQQRNPYRSRILKQSKSSPLLKDAPIQKPNRIKTCRSNKSLTTSPLFHIRYKSLTNLAADFNTLDSSNSGGQASSGSEENKDHKTTTTTTTKTTKNKLSRPRSLTNLFWDQIENHNKYNLLQNDKLNEGRPVIYLHDNKMNNKRIGTLYL